MRALNDLKKLSAAFSIILATMLVADDTNLSQEQNSTVLFNDQQMSPEEQQAYFKKVEQEIEESIGSAQRPVEGAAEGFRELALFPPASGW